MSTVTIAEINDRGVKPEGAGWANYSGNYDGPRPLIVGETYEVDIQPWTGKRDGKQMWFLNSAALAGTSHAPPPAPSALPPHPADVAPSAPTPSPTMLPPVDPTRASSERQVALKVAVEAWRGTPAMTKENVIVYADHFYAWLRNEGEPTG